MTQPTPQPNEREHVQKRAIEQLTERYQFGVQHYKTGLQIGNGRRMAMDAREEAQDLLIYMTGVEMIHAEVGKIVGHLIELHNRGAEGTCATCYPEVGADEFPCHTRVDLLKILDLLGEKHD